MEKWYSEYLERYNKSIFQTNVYQELMIFKSLALKVKENNSKIIFAGNGASSTIASHASTDFTKQGKIKSICFSDSSLITAYGNDYGYENWVSEAIKSYSDNGDLVVLVSSSGTSKNIINAAVKAKELGLKIVTFTGFSESNPLKQYGDVNFWLESEAYNIIENTHSIWICTVVDMIIGKAEYKVS